MRRFIIDSPLSVPSLAGFLVTGMAGGAFAQGDWTVYVNLMIGETFLGDGGWGRLPDDHRGRFGDE